MQARKDVKRVNLLGLEDAGLWCLLAASQAEDLATTVVDVQQFDMDDDANYLGEMYIPNLRRAGDFTVAGALIAPRKLIIHDSGNSFKTDFIRSGYGAAGAMKKLVVQPEQATEKEIVTWLCGK